MKTMYEFLFELKKEKLKQVQAEPIVIKDDNLKPKLIIDRDVYER